MSHFRSEGNVEPPEEIEQEEEIQSSIENEHDSQLLSSPGSSTSVPTPKLVVFYFKWATTVFS